MVAVASSGGHRTSSIRRRLVAGRNLPKCLNCPNLQFKLIFVSTRNSLLSLSHHHWLQFVKTQFFAPQCSYENEVQLSDPSQPTLSFYYYYVIALYQQKRRIRFMVDMIISRKALHWSHPHSASQSLLAYQINLAQIRKGTNCASSRLPFHVFCWAIN